MKFLSVWIGLDMLFSELAYSNLRKPICLLSVISLSVFGYLYISLSNPKRNGEISALESTVLILQQVYSSVPRPQHIIDAQIMLIELRESIWYFRIYKVLSFRLLYLIFRILWVQPSIILILSMRKSYTFSNILWISDTSAERDDFYCHFSIQFF